MEFWYIIFPSMVIGNIAIFNIIKSSASILSAFILYGSITMGGRVVYALMVHQQVSKFTWIATALMAIAIGLRLIKE